VYYSADAEADNKWEIFKSDLKTSTIVKISGPLVAGGEVAFGFRLDSKNKSLVYVADQEVDELDELFRADLKTGSVTKLNPPLVTNGGVFSELVQFDSTGRFLSYPAVQDEANVAEAFQVDLKTGAVIQLNAPLVSGGTVVGFIVLGGILPFF